MTDGQKQTKPSLPAGVWVIPALVVLGNLGYAVWLGEGPKGLSKLAPLILFFFLVVPGSVLFLITYGLMVARLRSSPRPRGALPIVGLSFLAGVAACALAFGVLFGARWLEANLGQ